MTERAAASLSSLTMHKPHSANRQSHTSSRGAAPQLTPPILVTEATQLQQLLRELRRQPVVAVDTESDSLFAYYYKVCLIQLSVPEADYLVDPLALRDVTPLGSLFANPTVQKVFHAADSDIVALKRDYGFTFANIFDTLWSARILGWANRNLAAILKERFGIRLDKRAQRTNWGRRPLAPEQLAYARLDSRYLLPLREMQIAELTARSRMEEATEAFGRLPGIEWEEKPFDPDGFWRLNGARELSPRALAVLRSRLYEIERQQQVDEQDQARRLQVGTGERSEKIRTYNFPQNRVTDHRIGKTLYRLEQVLKGDLDEFIDELATTEQAEKLQAIGTE